MEWAHLVHCSTHKRTIGNRQLRAWSACGVKLLRLQCPACVLLYRSYKGGAAVIVELEEEPSAESVAAQQAQRWEEAANRQARVPAATPGQLSFGARGACQA